MRLLFPGRDPGRRLAYVGVAFGAAASVAANIAHAYAESSTAPEPGAVVAAAFWPVALLVAIEVLLRITWAPGRLTWLVRYGGVGAVAGVAAVVSYQHLNGLLRHYGESGLTARTGPMAIDGLMLVCSAALLQQTAPIEVAAPAEATPINRSTASAPSIPLADPASKPTSPVDLAGSAPTKPVEPVRRPAAALRSVRPARPKVEARADERVAGTDEEKVVALVAAVREGLVKAPLSVAAVGSVVRAGGDKRKELRDQANARIEGTETSGDVT